VDSAVLRELAADIAAVGRADQRPDPALSVAARFSMLRNAIADARATTCAPGTSEVGDRGLWELLSAAMQRAETQLADFTPDLAATGNRTAACVQQ
jgi:hypothetical protein